MKDLDVIIENVGIEDVMYHIYSQHSDKVFIPGVFYKYHLENMGFDFSKASMEVFDEYIINKGAGDEVMRLLERRYLDVWNDMLKKEYS